jgi:hypothetical protein
MRIFYNPAHHWVTRAAICLDFFAAGVVRRGVWFFSISFVVPCQRQMVHRDGRTDASENKGKKRNEPKDRDRRRACEEAEGTVLLVVLVAFARILSLVGF